MPLHGKCRAYSHGGSPSLDRLLGVSVAVFRTGRPLRVVDCTKGADRHPSFINGEPFAHKTNGGGLGRHCSRVWRACDSR
jgi:hypothetical protein